MTENRESLAGNPDSCVKKIKHSTKVLVAYDRLMGTSAKKVAKKHGINEVTISRWENHDEEYAKIVTKHCADVRRGVTSKLLKDMGDVAANVMAAAKEDAELGFKVLKELGAFKTSGKEVGMTQEEVAQAGGVTIQVNLGQPEAPITVDAGLVEDNESE